MAELKSLREKYNTNFLKLQNVKDKLNKLNTENDLRRQKSNIEKTLIGSLMTSNKVLTQRLQTSEKMLQLSQSEHNHTRKQLDESSKNIDKLEESDTHEVEKLVGHKIMRKQRFFKVRWKGFSSVDDTWVEETDLYCPDILQAYKNSRRMKK